MKCSLVSIRQAAALKELGFKEPCIEGLPSVDQAIDFIRRKYNIHIVNRTVPFVDPTTDGKISYNYCVKKCYTKRGWNFREIIASHSSHNIYAVKRMCITRALSWIKRKKAKIVRMK
jgi:hypothetical protein